MEINIDKVLGLIYSQRVMLSLVGKGLEREAAYALVQRNTLKAWETKEHFAQLVLADQEIRAHLSEEEVKGVFDSSYHTKHVDTIFRRVGLLS